VLIDQLISLRGLTASSAGLVVSTEMVAMALTSYLLAKVLRGGRFLTLGAAGISVALLGSFLSLSATSLTGLMSARLLAGIGEGACLLVGNTAIVCFADRERTFANMGLVNVVFGVALVGLLPVATHSTQAPTSLMALFVALCLLAPATLLMPAAAKLVTQGGTTSQVERHHTNREAGIRIALLSLTVFIVGVASGVMWSFYGIIGQGAGLSETSVNAAIATSILTAIAGSSLATLLGNSFGRVVPVTLALVLMTAAIVSLSFHPTPWVFRVATCVNVSTLYFIMPYMFAAGSIQDESGLGATYVASAFVMTGAVSPFLGGVLVDTVGTEFVGVAVVVTSIVAALLFAYVQRRSTSSTTA
jgi:MFS family permease